MTTFPSADFASSKSLSGTYKNGEQTLPPAVLQKLTGRRMMYATKVEHAAAMNTIRRLPAYESRAARCSSGGRVATVVAECRILVISCAERPVSCYMPSYGDCLLTSSAPGPTIRLCNSVLSDDWKIAAERATPPTWPEE